MVYGSVCIDNEMVVNKKRQKMTTETIVDPGLTRIDFVFWRL